MPNLEEAPLDAARESLIVKDATVRRENALAALTSPREEIGGVLEQPSPSLDSLSVAFVASLPASLTARSCASVFDKDCDSTRRSSQRWPCSLFRPQFLCVLDTHYCFL